jgi:4-aminobutyrate aminotransferase/(S)-3-amino-2-methylpropionate transaminase
MDGLKDLSKRYPQHIKNNVRGIGTFCAFDLSSPQKRDETFVKLQHHGMYELNLIHFKKIIKLIFFLFFRMNSGVQSGPCGEQTLRLRPSLVFQPHHADIFLDILETVLNDIQTV